MSRPSLRGKRVVKFHARKTNFRIIADCYNDMYAIAFKDWFESMLILNLAKE